MTPSPRVVFLTGAGLSADSGVPTFRGDGGLYQGIRAEEVLSAQSIRNRPELVHQFIDDRRVALNGIAPNAAHEMIARLALEFGDRVVHLTQNIDDLMEKLEGGSSTIHLHGFLTRMRSIGNSKVVVDIGYKKYWDGKPEEAPEGGFRFRCPKTNSHFRPDVVLFNELAPEYSKLWRAIRGLRPQDTLVVIGTQGNVLPVSDIAASVSSYKILNNLHRSADIDEGLFDSVFMEGAASASQDIETIIKARLVI